MAHVHDTCILDLNADAVEFCARLGLQHLFAAGTYELDEATQTRAGRLYVYAVAGNLNALQQIFTRDSAGIFDMKWRSDSSTLALALADGTVQLLDLAVDGELQVAVAHSYSSTAVESSMALSLSFAPDGAEELSASYSCGSVEVFQVWLVSAWLIVQRHVQSPHDDDILAAG